MTRATHEAFDRHGRSVWRPCWLDRHAPYHDRLGRLIRDGYYIRWADLSIEDYQNGESGGGWTPIAEIRPIREIWLS